MIFYTLDRSRLVRSGSQLGLFSADPYKNILYEITGIVSAQQLIEHQKLLFPNGMSSHGWNYLYQAHMQNGLINPMYVTEINFEHVRQLYFADKPSRFQSLFGCLSINDAKEIRAKYGSTEDKIFEVSCEVFLKADMSYLLSGVQNIAGSFFAHQYWRGEATSNPFWEILMVPPVTVVREIA